MDFGDIKPLNEQALYEGASIPIRRVPCAGGCGESRSFYDKEGFDFASFTWTCRECREDSSERP